MRVLDCNGVWQFHPGPASYQVLRVQLSPVLNLLLQRFCQPAGLDACARAEVAFYERLFAQGTLVREFAPAWNQSGPTLRIYQP